MLATVIESKEKVVTILMEDENTYEVGHNDEQFQTYQEYYESESLFEFDPLTKRIGMPAIKKGELEDFSLPDGF